MTKKPHRKLYWFAACGVAASLLWSSLGTLDVSAQEKPAVIARAHTAQGRAPTFDKPIYLLMLGGDAHNGNPSRVRMDSIHIVAIDPVSQRASILGIPRDSYVEIPGRGQGKITGAGTGGPELMIQTVERLSGCKFDYYTLTSFDGFERLVDQFGGISFVVDKRYYERGGSKIDLQPGRQVFTGKQALAWARNRKVGRPLGDFDRSRAQGDLLIAALTEARTDYGKNPGIALRALGTLRRNLKLNIPLDEALKLGLLALRIDPSNVRNDVVDGENANVGGSSIVRITTSGKTELVDICSDGQLGS